MAARWWQLDGGSSVRSVSRDLPRAPGLLYKPQLLKPPRPDPSPAPPEPLGSTAAMREPQGAARAALGESSLLVGGEGTSCREQNSEADDALPSALSAVWTG